ncbi:MAG TPA: phosphoribosylanthranilate isomerase [Candidatus Angelobacter sp.]
MHTWIKICGTTSLEDALSSIEAGADALGFIFAESKRRVTPEQAQAIIRELPRKVEKIGVFMNAGAKEIGRVVKQVKLTGIQMHGDSDIPAEVYRCLPWMRRAVMRKIKTVIVPLPVGENFDLHAGVPKFVNTWLLDSGAGSGQTFDWSIARWQLGGRFASWPDYVIAGGLTPENVGEAIRFMVPWGVDVVSGVEREPGRKDPEKLKAFVAAVRRAKQI